VRGSSPICLEEKERKYYYSSAFGEGEGTKRVQKRWEFNYLEKGRKALPFKFLGRKGRRKRKSQGNGDLPRSHLENQKGKRRCSY